MNDSYRTVTCTLRQRRASAIMVEVKNRPGWHSIPRSCLHGADDLKLDRGALEIDSEITIRVQDWKAEQEGLA